MGPLQWIFQSFRVNYYHLRNLINIGVIVNYFKDLKQLLIN